MALTGAERKRLKSIWADALAKAQPELEAAREKWLEARGAEIAKARKVEPKEGRRIAEREAARFEAGELRDDFPIHLDSGEWVTVYQILSDPDRYAGARCWSLDETVPRPGVGFIQPYPSRPDPSVGKPPGPWLHSFEHGGRYWRLRSLRAETERIADLPRAIPSRRRMRQMPGTDENKRRAEAEEEKFGQEKDEPGPTENLGNGGDAGGKGDWDDTLRDIVERTKGNPGAFFRTEDVEQNLAAAWRLRKDDEGAWITLRGGLGKAGCPSAAVSIPGCAPMTRRCVRRRRRDGPKPERRTGTCRPATRWRTG